MKRSWLFTCLLCVLATGLPAFAQTDSTAQAREDARVWAEVRKPFFRSTRDDSLFVVNNSDSPFRYDYYSRADQLGVLEGMFFNSQPGEVIGPLFLEEYAMLFKIVQYDSLYRLRVSHLYVKPEGKSRKDTLNAVKKANQYLKEIQQGANFEAMVRKYSKDENAQQGGDLGWLWQGMMIKEFDQALATAKKDDVLLIKTPLGAHIVKVTEAKVLDRSRVKVVPLMRKI